MLLLASVNSPPANTGSIPAHAPRALWVLGLYAILSALVVPVYPHFPSPNEFSRWALTVSIVERGSFEVGPLTRLNRGFRTLRRASV